MEPIVMLPGLGSDVTVWERTIQHLGPDYDCQVGETLSDDSIEAMARRILAAAPSQFALAGVSMGGKVAIAITGIAPDRVTRRALFDTNVRPDTPEQTARRLSTNAAMLATTDLRALVRPGIAYMVHPDAGESVRNALAEMTVRVGAEAYVRQNQALAECQDLSPMLANIGVPTMVAIGAEDRMTARAHARKVADAIPQATWRVISGLWALASDRKAR